MKIAKPNEQFGREDRLSGDSSSAAGVLSVNQVVCSRGLHVNTINKNLLFHLFEITKKYLFAFRFPIKQPAINIG